jgi:hypothetical protein
MIRLEGGLDATPVDGTGVQVNRNATLIPEPAGLEIFAFAGAVAGAWFARWRSRRRFVRIRAGADRGSIG